MKVGIAGFLKNPESQDSGFFFVSGTVFRMGTVVTDLTDLTDLNLSPGRDRLFGMIQVVV